MFRFLEVNIHRWQSAEHRHVFLIQSVVLETGGLHIPARDIRRFVYRSVRTICITLASLLHSVQQGLKGTLYNRQANFISKCNSGYDYVSFDLISKLDEATSFVITLSISPPTLPPSCRKKRNNSDVLSWNYRSIMSWRYLPFHMFYPNPFCLQQAYVSLDKMFL